MRELAVRVVLPGEPPRIYRFADPVIRIGRSPDCQLAICHEAVPRELCVAWLEDDGRTVHVEERAGLTNPLLHGNRLVRGGVSGERVELAVGPILLGLAPSAPGNHVFQASAPRRISRAAAAAALLAAVALFGGAILVRGEKTSASRPDQLPEDPWCSAEVPACGAPQACREQARLLATRAEEVLARPSGAPEDRVRAVLMLDRAERLAAAGGAPDAGALQAKLAERRRAVTAEYRREAVALKQLVRAGSEPTATEQARRVLAYLAECHPDGLDWLRSLSGERE